MAHNKYRVYCETEALYVVGYSDEVPTVCPNNNQHTIDPSQTVLLEKFDAQRVKIESPEATDGKPIFLPCLFPGGVYLYIMGAGDHPTQGIGNGDLFQIHSEVAEDKLLEFQFSDAVYLAGGGMTWTGARAGDHVSFILAAHATPVTPNAQNHGNCNLVDPGIGAPILIVPADGDGAFDVDLSTAVPVPAFEDEGGPGNGFYNFDSPMIGKGTITAGTPQQSQWNLYAIEIPLSRFAAKLPILGDGSQVLTVPAVKPKKILPQWEMEVVVHHAGTQPLSVGWYLTGARTRTI